jgi:chaperonin cofactor prefoldin
VASIRNQLEKLLKQIVDVDKQITDLKNFKAGEPSTNASGVQLDRRYEREPVEVQIRALQDKKKDLQAKVDALYDEARKKGVESGELP